MRYAFDPELAAALALMADVDIADVGAARAAQAAELAAAPAADTAGAVVRDVLAPALAEGAPKVPLRVYRPAGRGHGAAAGPLPAVYTLHGGGFVLGSPEVDHDTSLRFCRELPAVVVSPDYRLAPEHPYPAALDDCLAGLWWLAENAAELGADPARIGLWGDSAGAGLAAGLALLTRDRGGPPIRCQHLQSPALDDRLATPSARTFTDTPVWNRRNALLSWEAYLGPGVPGSPDVPPYAAPGRATDLAGLPPASVAVMEFDPLRDEALAYAEALKAAGVPVRLRLYRGTFHGAVGVAHAAVARRIVADARDALRAGLAADGPAAPSATEAAG
ncbi:alpha/beta hydrolase [Streptomyces sp. WMMC500]|uniref:alpha/beta hydrolase n=1 Tax=Streptomyces sp. WMMC500 TaxID=3015154 RepID=UPI00248BCB8D|nr:alpha/beta hydrolase [Streptomyces sp. WMMC500]WBB61603.1 alpha/beta hydrolase [Streptomyces sp. WMMC500]